MVTKECILRAQMLAAFGKEEEILHACIRDNDMQELRRLIKSPAGPYILDQWHYQFGTPLNVAIWCENLPAVAALIEAGADPVYDSRQEGDMSPMQQAIRCGKRDIVLLLWAHIPAQKHANGDCFYRSCLYWAALYGQASLVGDILIWWDGWTDDVVENALYAAVSRWHVHVVDLLLKATSFSKEVLVETLHKAVDFIPSMIEEQAYGVRYQGIDYVNFEYMIARIIDAGVDPNVLRRGQSVLFKAGRAIDLTGSLKALLEKGADPNTQDGPSGQSVLHILGSPIPVGETARNGYNIHETGIRLLLRHGASVLRPDAQGNTPLHCAAFGTNARIFCLYLSHQTEKHLSEASILNVKNHQGETLLHWAAAGGKIGIIEYLILHGADVHATSANGWTPLMCALAPSLPAWHPQVRNCTKGKKVWEAIQAARLLLSHGADPLVSTAEGWTPIHCLARWTDNDEEGSAANLAEDLISRGARVDAPATMLPPVCRARDLEKSVIGARKLQYSHFAWGSQVQDVIELSESRYMFVRPGMTPLHWAIAHAAVGVARVLLAHGADPSATSPSGDTPAQLLEDAKLLPKSPLLKEKLAEMLVAVELSRQLQGN